MKKFVNLYSIVAGSLMLIALVACEPQQMDKPSVDPVPQPGQTKISIKLLTVPSDSIPKPGVDTAYFQATNNSSIVGQAHWLLSGIDTITKKALPLKTGDVAPTGETVIIKIRKAGVPAPKSRVYKGRYKILLTLTSNGGVGLDSAFVTIQ